MFVRTLDFGGPLAGSLGSHPRARSVRAPRARTTIDLRCTHTLRNDDLVLFRAPGCEFDDMSELLQRAGIGEDGLRLKGGGAGADDMRSVAAECGIAQSTRWGCGLTTWSLARTSRRRDSLRLRGGLEMLNSEMYDFSSNPPDSGACWLPRLGMRPRRAAQMLGGSSHMTPQCSKCMRACPNTSRTPHSIPPPPPQWQSRHLQTCRCRRRWRRNWTRNWLICRLPLRNPKP